MHVESKFRLPRVVLQRFGSYSLLTSPIHPPLLSPETTSPSTATMPSSPKRKTPSNTTTPADSDSNSASSTSKKPRMATPTITTTTNSSTTSLASEIAFPPPATAPPDAQINPASAIAYWSSTEATISGVLGGFPQVSRIDLQGSSNFLAKLRRGSKYFPPEKKLRRAVDCGAGIGRITEGLLVKVAERVDVVEPVQAFTEKIAGRIGVGRVWNVGLEEWEPEGEGEGPYDLIWTQWCLGQLRDAQAVAYLKRVRRSGVLSEGGWIVVKENLSNHHLGEDVYDDVDSSVTRTDEKFRRLFEEAGLKIVSTEVQRGMPKGLYAVRTYALQPR